MFPFFDVVDRRIGPAPIPRWLLDSPHYRRHQPAVLALIPAPHSTADLLALTPGVSAPMPRATLIELAADPRFARHRQVADARPGLRMLLGQTFLWLGLHLIRSHRPG
jgi:hypothetical protein